MTVWQGSMKALDLHNFVFEEIGKSAELTWKEKRGIGLCLVTGAKRNCKN